MIDIPTLLDTCIIKALEQRVSDIHIQPYPHDMRVRFRTDGVLSEQLVCQVPQAVQLIARIKVLAQLDVAEKRRPQDGTFSFTNEDHDCDIRVATFPSQHGEKLVLRLLDKQSTPLKLDELGMSVPLCTEIEQLASHESGFIVVTGPTGSGKTTTVRAVLASLPTAEKNIVTLEDPIEYILPGVTQSQIQPELGLTFEAGLRALLRQDPDVIMVGEIRDSETAQVAIQAALTGHQVISTLHTTDAPGALMRLVHMGCERFLVAAAVKAILAQRLVRKLCRACVTTVTPTDEQRTLLKSYGKVPSTIAASHGCEACRGTGYQGRVGIFQLLTMSPVLRAQFIKGADYDQITELAREEGMRSLSESAYDQLEKGVIDFAQWMRVTV